MVGIQKNRKIFIVPLSLRLLYLMVEMKIIFNILKYDLGKSRLKYGVNVKNVKRVTCSLCICIGLLYMSIAITFNVHDSIVLPFVK